MSVSRSLMVRLESNAVTPNPLMEEETCLQLWQWPLSRINQTLDFQVHGTIVAVNLHNVLEFLMSLQQANAQTAANETESHSRSKLNHLH